MKNHIVKNGIIWTKEAEQPFCKLKKYLRTLPKLASPRLDEPLVVYISTNKEAISTMLITKRDKKKILVYFVSRVLQGAEINFSHI